MKEYGLQLKSNQNKTCAIRYLAVDNKYRSFGIGKALLKQGITHAKKDKNKRIILHTMDTMNKAIELYTNYGFFRYENIDFINNGIFVKGYSKVI